MPSSRRPAAAAPDATSRDGGIFRISSDGIDYVDPALSYSSAGWAILDTTCARLMRHPDKPPPEGLRLIPEVAADVPEISRNGRTYTFTLRTGFRFSDGTPVQASAFARAINRTLAPGVQSPGQQFTLDVAGAADVLPAPAYFSRIGRAGESWDLTVINWGPDFIDPFTYISQLFDPQFSGNGNIGRFDSPPLTRLMRRAARLQGAARYRAYGELDVRLAREAAPTAALSFFNEPTLVSKRVGCIVLRPALDLTAACLK